MAQQAHHAEQAHAGTQHLGGEGVPESMAGSASRLRETATVRSEDSPDSVVGGTSTAGTGHEPCARARSRRLESANQRHRGSVERYESLVVQLAERDLEHGTALVTTN